MMDLHECYAALGLKPEASLEKVNPPTDDSPRNGTPTDLVLIPYYRESARLE
jgi:hypothetical protein